MEDTHWDEVHYSYSCNNSVLILVLMEDTHWEAAENAADFADYLS